MARPGEDCGCRVIWRGLEVVSQALRGHVPAPSHFTAKQRCVKSQIFGGWGVTGSGWGGTSLPSGSGLSQAASLPCPGSRHAQPRGFSLNGAWGDLESPGGGRGCAAGPTERSQSGLSSAGRGEAAMAPGSCRQGGLGNITRGPGTGLGDRVGAGEGGEQPGQWRRGVRGVGTASPVQRGQAIPVSPFRQGGEERRVPGFSLPSPACPPS